MHDGGGSKKKKPPARCNPLRPATETNNSGAPICFPAAKERRKKAQRNHDPFVPSSPPLSPVSSDDEGSAHLSLIFPLFFMLARASRPKSPVWEFAKGT